MEAGAPSAVVEAILELTRLSGLTTSELAGAALRRSIVQLQAELQADVEDLHRLAEQATNDEVRAFLASQIATCAVPSVAPSPSDAAAGDAGSAGDEGEEEESLEAPPAKAAAEPANGRGPAADGVRPSGATSPANGAPPPTANGTGLVHGGATTPANGTSTGPATSEPFAAAAPSPLSTAAAVPPQALEPRAWPEAAPLPADLPDGLWWQPPRVPLRQIPRCAVGSPLAKQLLLSRKPVVLTHGPLVGSAAGKWTLDYLRANLAGLDCVVYRSASREFTYWDEAKNGGYPFDRAQRRSWWDLPVHPA